MAQSYSPPGGERAPSPAIILAVDGPAEEAPLQVPVTVQNLAPGVVTLEVKPPWSLADWERLHGRQGRICIALEATEAPREIQGALTWTRYAGDGHHRLRVGLELAHLDPETRKILEEQISHTSKDIKGLWDRWDQAGASPPPALSQQKVYVLGLALLMGGVACQLAGPPSYKFFGWVLWFFGSLALAGKSLWSLWQKRLSR